MQAIRNFFRPAWTSTERLEGKTVLITGANTGIGKQTAVDLARRGAKIIMACRDMEKAQAAAKEVKESSGNDNIVCMKLDLADSKSIREFAQAINQGESKLNILINNAGVMVCPYGKTADGFELQIGINHMGHFLLTYLLLDLIKRSAPARIINVSSMIHSWGSINLEDINSEKSYDKQKAYAQSKLANVLFTRSLAQRLQGTGVTAYSLHPGVVQTDLWRHLSGPQRFLMKFASPFTKSSAQGAQTTIYCAVEPALENESGGYYSDCAPANCSAAGKNDVVAQKLWELSCQMLNITWE
ncbi:retinol dehydrogenase 12, like isoform X1 [Dunckerocampus dactyliophorus]|uniref:retinol dehydrogenase 12, like isoform X1 n=1 Tax=Dunckerocampus dactyliophorus TaxID=161453 RepID=UPI002406E83C|nr:retinol dehydrogenase 12, like isoform X1 [Dunckerocampus dactyliophorus]XP_054621179.1 retinol dehydrogenase 12, like isoform X1 [Dunckerocampus dactyliophorus]XP_054621180.1 retinol dehydrogenase 12, like isoform X1 [Dunckerocampus dactyliophorus]XP_054621181.1 retinol dehydrogenase 12, like isoform X1 [Dunckerocampus dactyliophorus]